MKTTKNNIILIGMPASGKTTAGALFAEKTGLDFLDTDALIEKTQKKTIMDIFKENGEEYFRELEFETLQSLLNSNTKCVLSTGGGMVKTPENRELLKKLGTVVYLKIEPDKIFDRIKEDKTRPLLQKENPKKALNMLYATRKKLYEAAADYTVNAELEPNLILKELLEIYEKING